MVSDPGLIDALNHKCGGRLSWKGEVLTCGACGAAYIPNPHVVTFLELAQGDLFVLPDDTGRLLVKVKDRSRPLGRAEIFWNAEEANNFRKREYIPSNSLVIRARDRRICGTFTLN